jgi:hypothetical protein
MVVGFTNDCPNLASTCNCCRAELRVFRRKPRTITRLAFLKQRNLVLAPSLLFRLIFKLASAAEGTPPANFRQGWNHGTAKTKKIFIGIGSIIDRGRGGLRIPIPVCPSPSRASESVQCGENQFARDPGNVPANALSRPVGKGEFLGGRRSIDCQFENQQSLFLNHQWSATMIDD